LHAAYEGRWVAGIELSPSAIAAAQRSAADLGLDEGQAVFRVGDAGASADTLPGPPGVVVVNPPRRGLDADLVRWLDDCPAQTMIYSSCNPQTLARDLAALSRWTVREARLFDMFPQTDHSEVAVLLGRAGS
jgi:23S rRNA (uracil747-C5)-methyltransferase